MCMSLLSQRARDQAFAPASMSMTTGYFRGKKKGKQNLKNFLAVQFPTYYSRNSTNGHLSATSSFFLADSPYMDSYILGSLSNDDGDVNENGKKAIVLDCGQNNNFARAPRFFCTFLCRRYTTPWWKCLISRFVENVNTRQRLASSFSELRYSLLELNSKIWRIEWDRISAIKFETSQLHFLSDVFVAIAVVVA